MILVVGDLMLDVLLLPELRAEEQGSGIVIRGGGSAANTAAWASYLGERSALVACAGDDAVATILVEELSEAGVGALIRRVAGVESGCVAVEITGEGERLMRSSRGANQELSPDDVRNPDAGHVDWVHVTGYALLGPAGFDILGAAASVARQHDASLSFDPSSASAIHYLGVDRLRGELVSGGVSLLLPNAVEAECLARCADGAGPTEAAGRLAQICPTVVKCGPSGAAYGDGTVVETIDTDAVHPVDTTGGGDAFNAAVIVSLIRGNTLRESCVTANAVAREAISRYGGRPIPRPITQTTQHRG